MFEFTGQDIHTHIYIYIYVDKVVIQNRNILNNIYKYMKEIYCKCCEGPTKDGFMHME